MQQTFAIWAANITKTLKLKTFPVYPLVPTATLLSLYPLETLGIKHSTAQLVLIFPSSPT